jgi:hypothetical protein
MVIWNYFLGGYYMRSDNVWTSDRREAYEFAKLLTVVDGVEDVVVKVSSAFEFNVIFGIKHNVHEHTFYVEVATLIKEYNFKGLNLQGEHWERAFNEINKEENY